MLRRLVPADPVWLAHFMAMEDPFLHSLELDAKALYPSPMYEALDWPMLVTHAYRAWERVFRALPVPLRELALRVSRGEVFFPDAAGGGYTLNGARGDRHVQLYVLHVDPDDLSALAGLLHRLRTAVERDSDPELMDSLRRIAEDLTPSSPGGMSSPAKCVDGFERALNVLHLKPDDLLLSCIPDEPTGQVVALDSAQDAAYDAFSRRISSAVTAHDSPWAFLMHRMFNA
ncbi:hypothetical protein ABZ883_36825 [Streptomyces sp. NPDC046977]|uniref:hypothetical protein n=1 Tax=Streptomyces sp. NPDC046977 TaxID=3154703 RepID=UPI0033E45E19